MKSVRAIMNLRDPPVHSAVPVGGDRSGDDGTGQNQDDDERFQGHGGNLQPAG
jgi:hypothetical protein